MTMTSLLRAVLAIAHLVLTAACVSKAGPTGEESAAELRTTPSAETSEKVSIGDRLAGIALAMVGRPYQFGGESPAGFDCSGLVYYAYAQTGVSVPRTSRAQRGAATTVPTAALQRGDLLFFETSWKAGHVGIYVGNGRFVHAPSSGKAVAVTPLAEGYFASRLESAGRLH